MKNSGCGTSFQMTDEELDAFNERFKAWMEKKDSLLVLDFCHEERITRTRLHQLCARREDLQETYIRAQQHTERMLLKGGLSNRFNAQFSRFILQAKHGYQTTEVVRHEGPAAPIIREYDGKSKDLTVKDKIDAD